MLNPANYIYIYISTLLKDLYLLYKLSFFNIMILVNLSVLCYVYQITYILVCLF